MWQVLLGAAVSLVGTLLAQWFSLSYQTKRQWEMRTAELRRTTLLQLLDALNDLGRSVWRVFILRGEALQRTGSWEAFSSRHPDVEAVSAAVNPVLIQSVAIKDEPLWRKIHSMTERAEAAAKAPSERDAGRVPVPV